MPASPLYNWLCVLHSTADILTKASAIRAAQLSWAQNRVLRPNRRQARENELNQESPETHAVPLATQIIAKDGEKILASSLGGNDSANVVMHSPGDQSQTRTFILTDLDLSTPTSDQLSAQKQMKQPQESAILRQSAISDIQPSSAGEGFCTSMSIGNAHDVTKNKNGIEPEKFNRRVPEAQNTLQSSRVPASRIGRFFHYGGLAASLSYGAAAEALRRTRDGHRDGAGSSLMMTPANVSRLVSKLSKMRGAALKLGQFMSIQDSNMLPKDVQEIFRKVQDSAHYMPNWQMERIMVSSLGSAWRTNFVSFEAIPFAAASLGQVHKGVLAASSSPTGKEERVAIKVQFPDIAASVDSDIGYMKILLSAGRLLPPGLFLDSTIKAMKEELQDECDYRREASFVRAFADCIGQDSRFRVPWVWQGSTDKVLVLEHMDGASVGGNLVDKLSQKHRDEIASRIIELCMKELFEYKMMQTDPNWTNFLWNENSRQIELIDFGATRVYSQDFIDSWLHLLQAAVREDTAACIFWSQKLGYLKGEENQIMLDAHVRSLVLLAQPFRAARGQAYAFGPGTDSAKMTAEIKALIPVMLQHRLTPPPRETYSLNRKLSGAFLLASRLGASVDCRGIWDDVVGKYKFD